MQCRLCLPFKNISELKKKPRMCQVEDLLKILKIGFLVTQVVSILGHNAGDICYILFSALQPKFNEIIQFYMLNKFLFFFSSIFPISLSFLSLFVFGQPFFSWWVPVYNKLQDFKHGYSKNLDREAIEIIPTTGLPILMSHHFFFGGGGGRVHKVHI